MPQFYAISSLRLSLVTVPDPSQIVWRNVKQLKRGTWHDVVQALDVIASLEGLWMDSRKDTTRRLMRPSGEGGAGQKGSEIHAD